MTRKLLASDYDSTFFYKTNPSLLPKNLDAVSRWQQQGNVFAISTGRDAASIYYEQEQRGIAFDYLVALNGAFIIDGANNVLFKQSFAPDIAQTIVESIRNEFNDELIISNGFDGCNFTNRAKSQNDPIAKEVYERNASIYTRSIEESIDNEVLLIGCLSTSQTQAHSVKQRILEQHSAHADVFINSNYINIVPKGISKASGIERIMQHAHIAHENVSVIGDDDNDIPMIEAFRGFAVPNAKPELIDIAEDVIDSVADLITRLS